MEINILSVSELSTNCYVLVNHNKSAIVIDAGGSFPHIKAFLDEKKLVVKAIVLTHGHYDHIGAVYELKELCGAPVYIHTQDNEQLLDAEKCLATHFIDAEKYRAFGADILLADGDEIVVEDMKLIVVHTKGHSKGSCVFLAEGYMFSGDTLFKNSYGRTDLYGGSDAEIRVSLDKLAKLEGDYVVFPGHGERTTLAYERITNPMMGADYDDIF